MLIARSEKTSQIRGFGKTSEGLRLVKRPTKHQRCRPFPSVINNRKEDRMTSASVSKTGNAAISPAKSAKQSAEKRIVPRSRELYNLPSVQIALDYYSILKARRVNSAELLKRSYENLLAYIPDNGYSKDTLSAREAILRQAADTMLDSDKRRAYDQSLMNNEIPRISIPGHHFSGALALLQECGEMPQVVQLGSRWLNENGRSPSHKDVALSVAKAYCDLASITLSSGEGVAMCCEELQAALDLLRACDVAPDLQVEITQALKELGPQYILEQLALPDELQFTESREKGFSELKSVLWEIDEERNLSPALNDRQGFLQIARSYLTAAKQIELYESCPKNIEIPSEELYDSALAYIAEGFRAKWPKYIANAEKVLQKLQLETLTSEFGGSDVSVEIGLCSLLLGQTDRAMLNLGLKPGSQKTPDRDVVTFVKANSPSEDDLLPGVCALAEVWLKDTIIPNYKEINMMTSSLGEWFQSPRVSVYLQVLENGKRLSLGAAFSFASSLGQGTTSSLSKVMEGFKNVFKKPVLLVHNESESVGRLKLPKVDIPRLSSNENNITRMSHLPSLTQSTETSGITASDRAELMEREMFNGASEVKKFEHRDKSHMKSKWWRDDSEMIASHSAHQKGGEMQIKNSSENKSSAFFTTLWKTLFVGSGVLLLLASGKWMMTDSRTANLRPIITSSLNNIKESVEVFFDQDIKHGTIDVPLAEEVIRRWHVTKSEALGAQHNVDELAEVLQGNMLKQWRERANTVRKNGSHWKYNLLDLTVDTVSLSRDGKAAVIEATIKEKAELIEDGRKVDSFSTSYAVQYDLLMKKQGWKISAARIVYESP